MSDSVRPHRQQPTRLPRPWDSPGRNTGVGCHFLLQCMKVKSESEVTQSCLTPSDVMDCSPPGSSVHGIFQARALQWVASAVFTLKPGKFSKILVVRPHYQTFYLHQSGVNPNGAHTHTRVCVCVCVYSSGDCNGSQE